MVTSGDILKDNYLQVALGIRSMGKSLVDLPRSTLELDSLGREYLKHLNPQSDIRAEVTQNLDYIQTVVD